MEATKRISGIRFLIALLAVLTAFGLMMQTDFVSAAEDGAADGPYYYDGIYQGTAYGYRSDVTVEITIADHQIADITVVSQAEDAAYWKKAVKILAAIKEARSLEVDTISGATVSSNAILEASKMALDQALSDPASPFVSGDGSEASPYTIATAAKLAQFAESVDKGETYKDKIIVLGGDMDLSKAGKWNPIGDEAANAANVFEGTFDGQGHIVTGMGLSGKYTGANCLGLFSSLGEKAVVKNLTLQDSKIKVKGSDDLYSGLIAGFAADGAAIDSCAAAGTLDVTSSGSALVFAGGLAGATGDNAVIANNWTDVNVEAATLGGTASAYAGGLLGASGSGAAVVNNAVFGEEAADAPSSTDMGGLAGGLAGMLAGNAWNNYAAGNAAIVSGSTVNTWVGVLAGQAVGSGSRINNYYPQEAVLTVSKAGKTEETAAAAAGTGTGDYDKQFTGTAVKSEEMQSAAFADTMNDTLVDAAAQLKAAGFEKVQLHTWTAADGLATPTGQIWTGSTSEETTAIFASGKGTKKNPYVIATADQLRAFAATVTAGNNYAKSYITLGADIDLSGAAWEPIRIKTEKSVVVSGEFRGSFDGAGHTIKGLTIGSQEAAFALTADTGNYVGLFPRISSGAVVKNVNLTETYINVVSDRGVMAGALVGYSAKGIIDGCSANGTLQASCSKEGNAFVGGLVGRNDAGAVVNSWTGGKVVCENTAAWAETGAIAGMNYSGLIANCYSLGDLEAKTGADNSGSSVGSLIAGYQCGDVVNCYAAGNLTTNDKTEHSGILGGWMAGYARAYNCWYNQDSQVSFAGKVQDAADSLIGAWPTAYADDEGLFYIGGLTDGLNKYRTGSLKALADGLNEALQECPVDIESYGLGLKDLKAWTVTGSAVVLTDEAAEYSYMRPACEEIPQKETVYQPGLWYGRSDDKSTIVAVTISENEVKGIAIEKGKASGDAYTEAVEKAMEKAQYGDTSGYVEADPTMFAGGSGTKEDPYQIANEAQLRYLAQSINEDVDWAGSYFKQTANIKIQQKDWTPIGWGIMAEIKATPTIYAQYPFRGNYDGDGYAITGLTIGSSKAPSADPKTSLAAGLFGIIEGDEQTNDTPQDPETRYVELKNIHLKDVDIHTSSKFDSYVGALAGDPELGFRAVNCSAEGTVETTADGDINMGGLMGYPLRGLIQNCWTNLKVNGQAAGTAYVGGLCGMDNRVTTVNCFTQGSVNAKGKSIYVGGLSGQFAGFRYNCYTAATVNAEGSTDYIGAVNGALAGIGAETKVYYSEKAKITVNGQAVEVKGTGVSAGAQAQNGSSAQADLGEALCKVLNENAGTAYEGLKGLHSEYSTINHHGHGMYYADETNASLGHWVVGSAKIAVLQDANIKPDASAEEAAVKAQKIVKVKAKAKKGKKAVISWKKAGSGYKYEVYRSLKKNKGFKKVSTTGKAKVTVKKLKAGKVYYFKVRGFKTVNGHKVYTKFSKTVKVKAKK
ncbi:MAG: FMN-binding protein [Firmicutes bacterium]|nr:FMN-binding protein [Bacillota bacterium]